MVLHFDIEEKMAELSEKSELGKEEKGMEELGSFDNLRKVLLVYMGNGGKGG